MRVARANFYPKLFITGRRWLRGLQTKYLFFTPESLIYSVAGRPGRAVDQQDCDQGRLPQRERQAIAEPSTSTSAVVLNAFTEVINHVSKVQNYSRSIEIKRQQLDIARSLRRCRQQTFSECPRPIHRRAHSPSVTCKDARMVLIETKQAATDCRRKRLSSPRRRSGASWAGRSRCRQPVPNLRPSNCQPIHRRQGRAQRTFRRLHL